MFLIRLILLLQFPSHSISFIVPRKNLVSLLRELDFHQSPQLIEGVGSFLQKYQSTTDQFALSPNSFRRRGGHLACECPDTPGDSSSAACLGRRFDIVQNLTVSLQTPNKSMGFSIEGGRMELRKVYARTNSLAETIVDRTSNISSNLSNPMTGYVKREETMSKRLLNEETLLAYSADNAWMNMVNISRLVDLGASKLTDTINNSTKDLISWFDTMQRSEEISNLINLNTAVSMAQKSLNVYVDFINSAQRKVFRGISNLSEGLGNATETAQMLTDSMNSAIDSVELQLMTLNQSLDGIFEAVELQINQSLREQIQQYQTAGQQKIDAFKSWSVSKLADLGNASKSLIEAQSSFAGASLSATLRNLTEKVSGVKKTQGDLGILIGDAFGNFSTSFASKVSDALSDIPQRVRQMEAKASNRSELVNQARNQLDVWNHTEKGSVMAAQVSWPSYAAAANRSINTLEHNLTLWENLQLTGASRIASDSVQGEGVKFQENMRKLGFNANDLIHQLSRTSGETAKASASVLGRLASSSLNGQQAVRSAATDVNIALRTSYGDTLDVLSNLTGVIARTSVVSNRALQQALEESKRNRSSEIADVGRASSQGIASAAGNQTVTEKLIGALFGNMSEDERMSRRMIDQIMALSGIMRTHPVFSTSSLSDSASGIANAENSGEEVLRNAVVSLISSRIGGGPLQKLSPGLSSALETASEIMDSAHLSLNRAAKSVETEGEAGFEALSDAERLARKTGKNAWRAFTASLEQTASKRSQGLLQVDENAAFGFNRVSSTVYKQLRKLRQLQKESAFSMGRLGESDVEAVRAFAATIDSLSDKVNAFLVRESRPLAKQIQGLAVDANRLLLQLNALKNEASSIESASLTTGGYAWEDILRTLGSLSVEEKSSASDQLDQLETLFDRAAENVTLDAQSRISESIQDYVDGASDLESQLGGINAQTAFKDSLALSQLSIANITQIQDSVALDANKSISRVQGIGSTTVSPTVIAGLYSKVERGVKAAAFDAKFANKILSQLGKMATKHVKAVNSFSLTDGFVNPADVAQQNGRATIADKVAMSRISREQATLKSLSASSTDLSKDYLKLLHESILGMNQNASFLHNQVVRAKSQVAEMVGNIAAEYANQHAEMGSSLSESALQQIVDTAALNHVLQGLLRVFDAFTGAANASLGLSSSDMNVFGVAILASLKRRLVDFEQQLIGDQASLLANISLVNSTLQSLNETDIDARTDSVSESFSDWTDSQLSALSAANSSLLGLLSGTSASPMDPQLVAQRTNDTVYSVAITAQNLLHSMSIQNSSLLDAIISNLSRNWASN